MCIRYIYKHSEIYSDREVFSQKLFFEIHTIFLSKKSVLAILLLCGVFEHFVLKIAVSL